MTKNLKTLDELMAEEDERRLKEMNTPEALAKEDAMWKRIREKSKAENIRNGLMDADGNWIEQPEAPEEEPDEDEADEDEEEE